MSEPRVILADCCEDWIMEWGGFYEVGREFECPECATGWAKTAPGRYRRMDGREFSRRERNGPEASFPYLASDSVQAMSEILIAVSHAAVRVNDAANDWIPCL